MGNPNNNNGNAAYTALQWSPWVGTTGKELNLHQTRFESNSDSNQTENMLDWFQKQRVVAWEALKANTTLIEQVSRAWDYPSDFNFEDAIKPWSLRIGWCVLMQTHVIVLVTGVLYIYTVLRQHGPKTTLERKTLIYACCLLGTDITIMSGLFLFLLIVSLIFRINVFKDAMPLISLVADGMQSTIYNILAVYGFFLTKEYVASLIPPEKKMEYQSILRIVIHEFIEGNLEHDRLTIWFLLSTLLLGLFYLVRSVKTMIGICKFVGRELFGASAKDPLQERVREAYIYTGGAEPYEKHLLELERQLANNVKKNVDDTEDAAFRSVYSPQVIHHSPWGSHRGFTELDFHTTL